MAYKMSSNVSIFARYDAKKDRNKSLIASVKAGTVTNIDYSNYRNFRACIKACAMLYFPKLFKEEKGKRKCILKSVLRATIIEIKNEDGSKIKKLDYDYIHNARCNSDTSDTVATVKDFLDSVLNYEFQGVICGNNKFTAANAKESRVDFVPFYHICSRDIHTKYVSNYNKATKKALEKVYSDKIGRPVDLKNFSCPFSQSIKGEDHNSDPEVDHVLPKTQIHEKLLASVYLLNKLRSVCGDQEKKDYDEFLLSKNKFYVLNLTFRRDNKSKVFIFATKILAVQVQNDTRNLMFMCSLCNERRKKGGWKDELVGLSSFYPIKDLIETTLGKADVSRRLILEEAVVFREKVVRTYTIDEEKVQDFKKFRNYLGEVIQKYPESVKEISKLAMDTITQKISELDL
ncbi:uncharacterized protein TRIADDRAFT_53355 [Trichoplax adhaerens]|uniref:Uncharacterized protein n=1 Tax=Trichoplax adhaerens TaxID=10228 RepID=B3RP03_TRIAD|nr:predicted protein [Trichoplax adhaerens]EDV28107.1 predicted protein [Trichoplax adhaerens]|eukprot:XP_002109941.1 predicted protein [Trichoplax adhaerens]